MFYVKVRCCKIQIGAILLVSSFAQASAQLPVGAPEPSGQLVQFQASDAVPPVRLRAILAMPAMVKKKPPAVMLIAGSTCDNGTMWVPGSDTNTGREIGLFSQIRDVFLKKGIAVFSYTKRGCSPEHGGTSDKALKKTGDRTNLLADNRAAFNSLETSPLIDKTKILILGYSEGNDYAWELALQLGKQRVHGLLLMGLISGKYIASEYQQAVTRRMEEFDLVDESHFGFITHENLKKFPCFDDRDRFDFASSDENHDGKLTRLEFRTWRERKWLDYIISVEAAQPGEFVPNSKDPADLFRQHFRSPSMIETSHLQEVPIAIFQGGADNSTPPHEAEVLRIKLTQLNKRPVFSKIYSGLSHGFAKGTGYRDHCMKFGPMDSEVLGDLSDVAVQMVDK